MGVSGKFRFGVVAFFVLALVLAQFLAPRALVVMPQAHGQTIDTEQPSASPGSKSWNYYWDPATSGWDRQRTVTVYKTVSALVVTTETTVWTPAALKRFRLMGFCLTQGVVTGAITLKDNTAGATILVIPPNTIGVSQCSPALGNGYLSLAANNVLTATGASTETVSGFFFGTEE